MILFIKFFCGLIFAAVFFLLQWMDERDARRANNAKKQPARRRREAQNFTIKIKSVY